MTEMYNIIADPHELSKFLRWLPDPEEHEGYLLALFARAKYGADVKGNNATLRQTIVRDKKHLFSRIRQMECPVGAYTGRSGEPLHISGLALYITVNPRDLKRARLKLAHRLLDAVAADVTAGKNGSMTAMLYSEAQKAKGRTRIVNFDIDRPKPLPDLTGILNPESYDVVETRGGWHILVKPALVSLKYKKTWHQQVSELSDDKNELLPVPGCLQGAYTPRFISED